MVGFRGLGFPAVLAYALSGSAGLCPSAIAQRDGCEGALAEPGFEKMQVGVSQNYGYPFGGPNSKDSNISGSISVVPYFGELPSVHQIQRATGKQISFSNMVLVFLR